MRSSSRRFALLPALLFLSFASCETLPKPDEGPPGLFYVDSVFGDDGNSGRDSSEPWRTLARVNAASVPAGSTVSLKCGSTFREKLVPKLGLAGLPVTYKNYGAGAKPILLGSVGASSEASWTRLGSTNIWRAKGFSSYDVGNILWVSAGGELLDFAYKEYSRAACLAERHFWYDSSSDSVEVYCATNPALLHPGARVELALGTSIVTLSDRSWITFEGLDLRYSGGYGFQGKGASRITIKACDISWIGGSQLLGSDQGVRYGNGVEFFADASDCLVEGNRIWEIYDTGITNQCYFDSSETGMRYRNNIVWNCGYASIEVWNSGAKSVLRDIVIEGNTCYAAGEGFGGAAGQSRVNADTAGSHLRLDPSGADTGGFIVRGNIFSLARVACALVISGGAGAESWEGWPSLVQDYNCWFNPAGKPVFLFAGYSSIMASYGTADLAAYRTALGKDAHSIAADPLFADAASGDFSLGASSPCLGAGVALGSALDFALSPRGDPPDIGALERP